MEELRPTTQPAAPPTPAERAQAGQELQRSARPRVILGVLVGAIVTGVGFGLLLVPAFGLVVLVVAGLAELFGDGLRPPPESAQGVVRMALLALGCLWVIAFIALGFRRWSRERRWLQSVAEGHTRLRNVASFRSARFNTTEEKATFVNPGCFGDDVVRFVLAGLASRGFDVDPEPGAEDFGWYGRFRTASDEAYDLIVSFQPEDDDGAGVWWVHVERAGLPMSRERQRRGGEVGQDAVLGVHEVLAGASGISHLGWHHEALER